MWEAVTRYYALDWLCMVFILLASYKVSQKKPVEAQVYGIIGCGLFGVPASYLMDSWPFVILDGFITLIYARGLWNHVRSRHSNHQEQV